MIPLALEAVTDDALFGGKAWNLGAALRAGLPVPPGFAVSWQLAAAIVAGDAAARAAAVDALRALGGPVAVRSSAVGEDAEAASFAGQHLTVVNVTTSDDLLRAIEAVHASGSAPGAAGYRARLEVAARSPMAVIVQRLIEPVCAGVLFTRDPFTGDDVRVVEASWGLGEAVVAGLVVPDRYRIARGGSLLEVVPGIKDVMLAPDHDGGTVELSVPDEQVRAPCLGPTALVALSHLADRVETTWPGAHDVEWAIDGEALFLLQRRPISRTPATHATMAASLR